MSLFCGSVFRLPPDSCGKSRDKIERQRRVDDSGLPLLQVGQVFKGISKRFRLSLTDAFIIAPFLKNPGSIDDLEYATKRVNATALHGGFSALSQTDLYPKRSGVKHVETP